MTKLRGYRKGKRPIASTDHAHQKLSVPAEEMVDERWILVVALHPTEALDLAYNLNTGDGDAVLSLYRFSEGKKDHAADRIYGLDQERIGLLDALFVVIEQFTLVARAWPLGPPPLVVMESETGVAASQLDRWAHAPYGTTANISDRAWSAMLQDSTNMATPIQDAHRNNLCGSHAVCPTYDILSTSMRSTRPGDVVARVVTNSFPRDARAPPESILQPATIEPGDFEIAHHHASETL
jgi:hypothetical protein